jgi:TIR domain
MGYCWSVGAWRSLVARAVRVGEVPGSNPGAPINRKSANIREDGRNAAKTLTGAGLRSRHFAAVRGTRDHIETATSAVRSFCGLPDGGTVTGLEGEHRQALLGAPFNRSFGLCRAPGTFELSTIPPMASGSIPTAPEVLSVLDRLERNPERRSELWTGYQIVRACVAEGIVGDDSIDWVAQRMQELHSEGLIAHDPISGGVMEPRVWNDGWLQSVHGWRVTSDGRADAELHERRSAAVGSGLYPAEGAHDVFICHAGEDKDTVAKPLAAALRARNWSVWLDELNLTVGDSLSGAIDLALARSRFGIVVLSRAFFGKPWPERELAGLAAKGVVAGSKVILPVWHGVDERYVLDRSPVLADRVGASTASGIEVVADKLSDALMRAGLRGDEGRGHEAVVQTVVVQVPPKPPPQSTAPSPPLSSVPPSRQREVPLRKKKAKSVGLMLARLVIGLVIWLVCCEAVFLVVSGLYSLNGLSAEHTTSGTVVLITLYAAMLAAVVYRTVKHFKSASSSTSGRSFIRKRMRRSSRAA